MEYNYIAPEWLIRVLSFFRLIKEQSKNRSKSNCWLLHNGEWFYKINE